MVGKKSDLGPSGESLTHTVRSLREARRLSYAELSRQLADMGRDIPPLGLRRLESGERRVDVDDLVALAVALGVSPITLLMPVTDDADALVSATGAGDRLSADELLDWLLARYPLPGDDRMPMVFRAAALPGWKIVEEVTEKRTRDAAWLKARRAQLREEKRDGS